MPFSADSKNLLHQQEKAGNQKIITAFYFQNNNKKSLKIYTILFLIVTLWRSLHFVQFW